MPEEVIVPAVGAEIITSLVFIEPNATMLPSTVTEALWSKPLKICNQLFSASSDRVTSIGIFAIVAVAWLSLLKLIFTQIVTEISTDSTKTNLLLLNNFLILNLLFIFLPLSL